MNDTTNEIILCACGCGLPTNYGNWCLGHWNKGKKASKETRQKQSNAAKNRPPISEETRMKLSLVHSGRKHTEEAKRKMSEYYIGKTHPNTGKHPSEDTKKKLSAAHLGKKNGLGYRHTEEAKQKISLSMTGKTGNKSHAWKGGVSFEPYCQRFNRKLKEEIRDVFERKCLICGITEEDNKQKLSVHHIDYDKMQGCDGKDFYLVPLCRSCNIKANFNRVAWNKYLTSYFTGMM